jgi:hypothetical protein
MDEEAKDISIEHGVPYKEVERSHRLFDEYQDRIRNLMEDLSKDLLSFEHEKTKYMLLSSVCDIFLNHIPKDIVLTVYYNYQ